MLRSASSVTPSNVTNAAATRSPAPELVTVAAVKVPPLSITSVAELKSIVPAPVSRLPLVEIPPVAALVLRVRSPSFVVMFPETEIAAVPVAEVASGSPALNTRLPPFPVVPRVMFPLMKILLPARKVTVVPAVWFERSRFTSALSVISTSA